MSELELEKFIQSHTNWRELLQQPPYNIFLNSIKQIRIFILRKWETNKWIIGNIYSVASNNPIGLLKRWG